jgi:ubiquitin-like modifier-activating enzyme ATG7
MMESISSIDHPINQNVSSSVDDPSSTSTVIKFVPFRSCAESAFWVRYCREKLECWQLSDAPISIRLSYEISKDGIPRLQCRDDTFSLSTTIWNNECVSVAGTMMGYNTLSDFQKSDKNELLRDFFCRQFFNYENDHAAMLQPSVLVLTYADLKQHKIVYWFGIPAMVPVKTSILATSVQKMRSWSDRMTKPMDTMRRKYGTDSGLPPYFIYSTKQGICLPLSKANYKSLLTAGGNPSVEASNEEELWFGFLDPTGVMATTTTTNHLMMGWPMRNLVAYLAFHLGLEGQSVQILSYRPRVVRRLDNLSGSDSNNSVDAVLVEPASLSQSGMEMDHDSFDDDNSILMTIFVPCKQAYEDPTAAATAAANVTDPFSESGFSKYRVVGWELNARSKPGPRSVNLKPLLDPTHLAIQAADLNLKLMKWRMIPELDVEKLQSSKVLLIGAGTLGCNVARVLLGWGIRNFVIIDNGKVSYSNPVRQSLFTLEDCHADSGSGRPKAIAAAEALKTIAADVRSQGIVMSIPMPGHPDTEESITQAVETLDRLVQETDIVFLITDTRESRWLPTVMAATHNKLLINAAMGLDSWLVMRHGGGAQIDAMDTQRLGCYFCGDIVAPENSTRNRTLDQQCTVTRPGLAMIASAMAVEMAVALLHHPAHLHAPAAITARANFSPTVATGNDGASGPLGLIPHQVRGSLVSYTMMTPAVPAFPHCTGCSPGIVNEYLRDKMDLVLKATCQSANSSYLEDLSGLTMFHAQAAEKLVEYGEWEEDDDDNDNDNE